MKIGMTKKKKIPVKKKIIANYKSDYFKWSTFFYLTLLIHVVGTINIAISQMRRPKHKQHE